jgi:hypothetical protein
LKSGGGGITVEEPLTLDQEYLFEWRESRVNLAELAKLRWIDGLTRPQLASHYQKSLHAITKYCVTIKKEDFDLEGLTVEERGKIRRGSQN